MNNDEFFQIWREFQGKGEEDRKSPCPIAAEFLKKVEETLFAPLAKGTTRGRLAQAKYMLQEEYHTWRRSMPLHHLRASSVGNHRCLSDVYDEAFDRMHLLELSLRPTMNLILDYEEKTAPVPLPPAPPPPPPPQIAGIYIGEDDE